jgi:hypothetical protein
MVVFSVGPDSMSDYDLDCLGKDYQWLIYWYESGDYCGSGEAVKLDFDGKLYSVNLSHCSCYGPGDGGFGGEGFTIDQFKESLDSVHGLIEYKEIRDKIMELID